MKTMKIQITRKSSGSYFIGTTSNSKQEQVFESSSAKKLAYFCQTLTGRFIKAEYSRSTTYYRLGCLTSDFFKKLIESKKMAAYNKVVNNVGKKVREKTAKFLYEKRKAETIAAFTPEVSARFVKKWNEIQPNNNVISTKEANHLAWKKQNYLGIDRVDVCELRHLLKTTINAK